VGTRREMEGVSRACVWPADLQQRWAHTHTPACSVPQGSLIKRSLTRCCGVWSVDQAGFLASSWPENVYCSSAQGWVEKDGRLGVSAARVRGQLMAAKEHTRVCAELVGGGGAQYKPSWSLAVSHSIAGRGT
jgi:hypothetical protein